VVQSAQLARHAIESYLQDMPDGELSDIAFVLFMPEELTEFRRGFQTA
jgi:hypothetical protein